MILLKLEKRSHTNKHHIVSWEYVTKEMAKDIKDIPGLRAVVNDKDVPSDFYKGHTHYFLEDGIVRYATKI